MNWKARPRVRLWIVCLMLMLSVMCFAATPEPVEIPQEDLGEHPILEPPAYLQNWGVTESGEKVLYFTEAGWTEFSGMVYAWAEQVVEESVATAVKPLLVENAGLKAEVASLRKPRRGTLLWILGVGAAGLVAGLVVGVAVSK